MKNTKIAAVILGLILIATIAYAGLYARSHSITDNNARFVGLSPRGLVSITADTAIINGSGEYYKAITPTTDVEIYYTQDDTTTYTVDALTNILVHPNLRLSTTTVCFIY